MTNDTAPHVHDLLLALAGRLDDDLVAWTRELLAVGEAGQAVELATAALAAERVVLPPPLRAALVDAARAARTDLDVESALPPPAAEDTTPHRFDAGAAPGHAVVAALTALPARRLAGCTLHLTWRRTPTGTAPGPLPRAVVLVEAEADRSPDVLAYLLATELDRAGVPASVEVFTSGAALPGYHLAALRSAREVLRRDGGQPAPTPDDAPAPDASLFTGSAPEPAPTDDPTVAVLGGRATTGRRRRPEPPADVAPEPAEPAPAEPPPAEPEGPVDTDPFNGPLRVPLLEPLLEPPGLVADDPGPGPEGSAHTPVRAEEPGDADPAPPTPDRRGSEPAAPARPADPAEWDRDWRSGEWAMPRPTPPDGASDRAFDVFTAAAPGAAAERAAGGEVSLFDSPTARVGPGARPTAVPDAPSPEPPVPFRDDPLFGATPEEGRDGAARGEPDRRPQRPGPDLPRRPRRLRPDEPTGLPPAQLPSAQLPSARNPVPEPTPEAPPHPDPEPSALLSGTERDLLAQLQAELAARDPRPRPYRRAGQNGRGVNGHDGINGHGEAPPDRTG